MEHSNTDPYDFMKLVIKDQSAIRAPQKEFTKQSLVVNNETPLKSRLPVFHLFENTCVCEEGTGPVDTFGSFSDGFDDGFDI